MAQTQQASGLPWAPGPHDAILDGRPPPRPPLNSQGWSSAVTFSAKISSEYLQLAQRWVVEERGELDVFKLEGQEFDIAPAASNPAPAPAPAPALLVSLKPQYSLYRVIMTHDYSSRSSAPTRGLFNTNNMCFFNSVLQALVHCTPFYDLIRDIYANVAFTIKSSTPVLDSLVLFAHRYASVGVQKPMSAEDFYSVICNHPKFNVQRDRQEDAQEFLAYLLDELESSFSSTEPSEEDAKDNLRAARHEAAGATPAEDDGWHEVGKGSKPVQTQHAGQQDRDNPVQELFGGRLRSVLVKKGTRQPSITTEPFLQVPVDISADDVDTVQAAVEHLLSEESLTLGNVPAIKRLEFERMPPILIVHLKRFTFVNIGGTFDVGKIMKPISIGDSLKVECGSDVVEYTPFAVVYHHGATATRGHYTVDVLVNDVWHHIDDDVVSATVQVGRAPANEESKAVYMVFYERCKS